MYDPTLKKVNGIIKGYKAFKKDAKGMYTDGMGNVERVYWYKGDTKKIEGELVLCKNGFHFFKEICFAINYLEEDNEIWEVEADGFSLKDSFKYVTNSITLIRKIGKKEIKKLIDNKSNSGYHNSGYHNSGNYNSGYCNSGNYNSGYCNSGDCNSGYRNSGNYNLGNRNSGQRNLGYRNSGYCNSGDCNLGNYNLGDYNTGNYNSGNYNTGNYNSGNYNSGNYNSGDGYINYFCTQTRYFLFDIEVEEIPIEIQSLDMSWFNLVNKTYKEAWRSCPKEVLNKLKRVKEFKIEENKNKFKEITGIDLDKE